MRLLLVIVAALVLAGCERAMQDMYDQPRYHRMQGAPDQPNGSSVRPLPDGSVSRAKGELAMDASGRDTAQADADRRAEAAQAIPYTIDSALLRRGRERFTIYCEPCHSPVGDGEGIVPSRGFPHPPSYHIDRLRQVPVGHFFAVMTNGYGSMPDYKQQVPPRDRWAIAAYIRALQLSQHFPAQDLTPQMRQEWEEQRSHAATGGQTP